jgi:hypothetical protein
MSRDAQERTASGRDSRNGAGRSPVASSRADSFESDPAWILNDARLVLAAGETTIELRERG